MEEEQAKESMYVTDAYKLLDYISKENPDVIAIEIYIRNHMYPGHISTPKDDFKERDDLPFHAQVPASKHIPNTGDEKEE